MDEDETDTKASFTPRSYQVQMMDIAMKQNTIIYLPTGSGKTFIAILVLKQLSEDLARFVLLRSFVQLIYLYFIIGHTAREARSL